MRCVLSSEYFNSFESISAHYIFSHPELCIFAYLPGQVLDIKLHDLCGHLKWSLLGHLRCQLRFSYPTITWNLFKLLRWWADIVSSFVFEWRTVWATKKRKCTYFRPQSEYLAMFFNVKAAVNLICLVIGPSLSSYEKEENGRIVC